MTSLVTDYVVIQSNTNVDMMPNIFNLTRVYEASDHICQKKITIDSLCKSRNKDAEWPPHIISVFQRSFATN